MVCEGLGRDFDSVPMGHRLPLSDRVHFGPCQFGASQLPLASSANPRPSRSQVSGTISERNFSMSAKNRLQGRNGCTDARTEPPNDSGH